MDLCFLSLERSQGIVLPFRNFQLSFLAQISIFNKYLGRKTGYSFKAFKPPTLPLLSYAISKSIPGFSFHNMALYLGQIQMPRLSSASMKYKLECKRVCDLPLTLNSSPLYKAKSSVHLLSTSH